MNTTPFHEKVKPQWIRLVDHRGRYAGSFDPTRCILMTVDRGGTATFDLAQLSAEWERVQREAQLVSGE